MYPHEGCAQLEQQMLKEAGAINVHTLAVSRGTGWKLSSPPNQRMPTSLIAASDQYYRLCDTYV
jgi:hypothetical protein